MIEGINQDNFGDLIEKVKKEQEFKKTISHWWCNFSNWVDLHELTGAKLPACPIVRLSIY
jgi:hypothetical protein